MSIRGSQDSLSLVDLLNLLHGSGRGGTLGLRIGERRARLLIFDGRIYIMERDLRGPERLIGPLVKSGKITEDDLDRALQLKSSIGHVETLGNLLVRMKLCSPADIAGVRKQHHEEEICDLLFEEEAEYEFRPDVFPKGFVDARGRITTFGFDVLSILMDASRRQDEWRRIRNAIPSDRAVLVAAHPDVTQAQWEVDAKGQVTESGRHDSAVNSGVETRIVDEWRKAYSLFETNPFDGTLSVEEVVEASGVSNFVAMGTIASLREQGLIRELTGDEIVASVPVYLGQDQADMAYRLFEWVNESSSETLAETALPRLDPHLLDPRNLDGNVFQTRASSERALRILAHLLETGEPFRFLAREGESLLEVFVSNTKLRLHQLGPRTTHGTARYLRRRNALTGEELQSAKKIAQQAGRSLESVLLEDGFVTREQFLRAVKDKSVSGMFSIFGWSDPFIEVEGGIVEPPPPSDIKGLVCEFPLNPKMREYLRHDLKRWREVLEAIPGPDLLCVHATAAEAPGGPRRPEDLFDGRRTVGELLRLARVAPYELVRFTTDMVKTGSVRPLSDREHYERIEASRAADRIEESIAYCKSAIGWKYAPRLYRQRLRELREVLKNRQSSEEQSVVLGEVGTISLADLIQHFHYGKRTGTLRVRDATRESRVYLDAGELYLLHVESDGANAWDLDRDSRSNERIGKLLAGRRGVVEEVSLPQEVRAEIDEDLLDVFLWEDAEFEFEKNVLPSQLLGDEDARAARLHLPAGMVLMQVMNRLAEWDQLKQALKSGRSVFRYTSAAEGQIATPMTDMMGSTVSLYNGRRTLDDIIRISGKSKLEVFRQAAGLLKQGSLAFLEERPKPPKPARQLRRMSQLGNAPGVRFPTPGQDDMAKMLSSDDSGVFNFNADLEDSTEM